MEEDDAMTTQEPAGLKTNPRQQGSAWARRASYVAAMLGLLLFWGGILISARHYPGEFDWRYMTLSTLISPRRDAPGYLWAAGGVVLSSLCALCWAVMLARRGGGGQEPGQLRGLWLVKWGSVCMACSVLLPWRLPRLPKEHEILTLLAFTALCLGMIRLAFQTAGRVLRPGPGTRRHAGLYETALAGIAVCPIFLAGLAEAYVYYVLPGLHWVSLSWRAGGIPMYLSFAFWEWITCAVLSAYLAVLALAV
jgi:hypothetical protein